MSLVLTRRKETVCHKNYLKGKRSAQSEREALYAEFLPLVHQLIRKYGGTYEMRKDLEGEIYYRFCMLLTAYDPSRGVPLKPYLVYQLKTSVYTFARREWRQNKREIVFEAREEVPHLVDPSIEWDEEIALQQVRNLLPGAIANLPLRQRQVVLWRYFEHRSFEEIAELMNIKVATTRSILRHGLNNLRARLADQENELSKNA